MLDRNPVGTAVCICIGIPDKELKRHHPFFVCSQVTLTNNLHIKKLSSISKNQSLALESTTFRRT